MGRVGMRLERHQQLRISSQPRLTVLTGPRAARLWRTWANRSGRSCIEHVGDVDELARAYVAQVRLERDLIADVGRVASPLFDTPAGELAHRWRRASDRERRAAAVVVQGSGLPAPLCSLAASILCPQSAESARVTLAGLALLLPTEELPALLSACGSANEVLRCAEALLEIASRAPAIPVAIAAGPEVLAPVLTRRTRVGTALREGLIELSCSTAPADPAEHPSSIRAAFERAWEAREALRADPDDPESASKARSAAELLLFLRLEELAATRERFSLNRTMPFSFGGRPAEIDLAAVDLGLAVEVDGYYHFTDPSAYRRDRRKDLLLQQHGYTVVRVLADDVLTNLDGVTSFIVGAVRHCTTGEDEI